jgi:hypothetical protein
MIPPYNPFAGWPILDLEAERVRLEREQDALSSHPSRTDEWQSALQRVEAQLVQVREEISFAGTSVVRDT